MLDRRALRRAFAGCEAVLHTAGLVASRPESEVWRVNAIAPRLVVEAAARAGVGRVVVTSSVGALGPATGGRAANEQNAWPEEGTGLIYTDAKHEGELAAFEAGDRLGLEVVAVNPAYVLGAAHNRAIAGETSTRIVANYLRGRLPAIVDSYTNVVDVEDVAQGHVLAASRGRAGRAVHPRRRQPALVGGHRPGREAVGRRASAAGAATGGGGRGRRAAATRSRIRGAGGHAADGARVAILVGEGPAGARLRARARRTRR